MREDIMRAVRAEMTYEELYALYRGMHEKWEEEKGNHYYDPDIFIDVCMKRIQKKIDDRYFETWLIILCNLLGYDEEHSDLADIFDGHSFADVYDARDCREIISLIREHDLRFKHPDILPYHIREKMKVIYLRFEFCKSEGGSVYKCYIVDHGMKKYDLRMIDESEIDYGPEKNYCHMFDEEHLADIRRQEEDDSLDEIDMSKPQKQHCEIEEELISLFHERYKRDKALTL